MNEEARKLKIACAKTAKAQAWTNMEKTWAQILNALKRDNPTSETMEEYLAMDKDRQAAIKDVGGFVGGELIDGLRRSGYVKCRSMVTLDVDDMTPADLETMETYIDVECFAYGTHKHTEKRPRVRLVIPLKRDVTESEYEPIARMLAKRLIGSLEPVDPTCYRTTQMMYWPSRPKDGPLYAKRFEGPWADPDALLHEYRDWRNVAEWPYSEKEKRKRPYASGKKLGDPREKPGVIGAFCEAYPISEAIETFLSDVYAKAGRDRYTYLKGSTHGGAIVFDDQYLYSNHSTDPAMGESLNSFDLVRIHLFGELDKDAKEGTPTNRLPSFIKMSEMAQSDPKVKAEMEKRFAESHLDAAEDFDIDDYEGEPEELPSPTDWMKALKKTQEGKVKKDVISNYKTVLENDPALKGLFGENVLTGGIEFRRRPPWPCPSYPLWSDSDEASLQYYLADKWGLTNKGYFAICFQMAQGLNSFDPIKVYLEKHKWDGKPRVDRLFIDYLGAEDCEYVRTVARSFLVAAVARVYEPGVKFDYMTVLVGPQGSCKSLLTERLGMQWHSATIGDLSKKEAAENLSGKWIMEIGELAAIMNRDPNIVKNFLTRNSDDFRRAYAKNAGRYPRRVVFVGTTNQADFITDLTGGRRFLPVDINKAKATLPPDVQGNLTPADVAQIWAEAKVIYDEGKKKGMRPMDYVQPILAEAQERQNAHSQISPWESMITEYLDKKIPPDFDTWDIDRRREFFRPGPGPIVHTDLIERDYVFAAELWVEAMDNPRNKMTVKDSSKIYMVLERLGWKRSKTKKRIKAFGGSTPQYVYIRPKKGEAK